MAKTSFKRTESSRLGAGNFFVELLFSFADPPETVVQLNKSSFKVISTEILLKVNVARAFFVSNSFLSGSS